MHAQDDQETMVPFEDLVRTIAAPAESRALSSEQLGSDMGIDALPTGDAAIEILEKEVLKPVRDLSEELWKWQA